MWAAATPSVLWSRSRARRPSKLEKAVKSATMELVTGKDDRLLRRLKINLDIGTDAPRELAGGLGDLSGAKVVFDLRVEEPERARRGRGARGRAAVRVAAARLSVGSCLAGPSTACSTSGATPSIPPRLGCTGAAAFTGTTGSTQRITGSWQASWPMLAVYQSTTDALLAAAWVASIWLSSFCFSRR